MMIPFMHGIFQSGAMTHLKPPSDISGLHLLDVPSPHPHFPTHNKMFLTLILSFSVLSSKSSSNSFWG